MKKIHNPIINLRYWGLIFLASIFGTNTGDIVVRWNRLLGDFTHLAALGLKHSGPLPILIGLFILIFLAERRDNGRHEFYFWSAIIIIRTAATNIADTLAGDLNIDFYLLVGVLSASLIYLALRWQSQRFKPIDPQFVPETNAMYWLSMLTAGVLGTVIGDEIWHVLGLTNSTVLLSALMAGLVYFGYRSFLLYTALYWFGIVAARISGTAVGDWLAKSIDKGGAGFDLPTATLISGVVFISAAIIWRNKNKSTTFVH